MVRVLHILDHDADDQAHRSASDLAGRLGQGFCVETRMMGPGHLRNVPSAVIHLRRDVADRFDLIHVWGSRSLSAAALATRMPIVYSPIRASARSIDWVRAVAGLRPIDVICPTATLRRRHVERGVPIERTHLIRPGVDFARVRGRRDPALREQLGFAVDDHVLLLAGESTRAAGHTDGLWSGAILNVLDPTYRVLAWGRGPQVESLRWVGRGLSQSNLLTIAQDKLGPIAFEALLPVADVVIVPARGAVATLPIASAMAAGLPIVATVTYTTAELLEDRHTAVMLPPRQPRQFAKRVLDLVADPSLRWSIADMARTEAYEYFALTRFLDQFRTVYRQLAAREPVQVPEQTAGAGLRFHGRG